MKKLMVVVLTCLLSFGIVSDVSPVDSPLDWVHPKI